MTPERTKEEILNDCLSNRKSNGLLISNDEFEGILKAMEEYKSQSQPVESKSDDVLEDHVTITLSFNIPTFGRFCDLMKTDSEMWPDLKEALKQLKATIEETK